MPPRMRRPRAAPRRRSGREGCGTDHDRPKLPDQCEEPTVAWVGTARTSHLRALNETAHMQEPATSAGRPTLPRVSLITVSYNSAATIGATIDSVLSQDYPELEYIVIDGASADGTGDIIRSYGDRIDRVVIEPDRGIYDAMNKGLRLASGEIIGFINADDFYPHDGVVSRAAREFGDDGLGACYGDLCYVDPVRTSDVVRYWKSAPFRPGSFRYGWCPPHPTFFVRRRVYERYGGFDERYRIASDIELMMRFLEVHGIRTAYIPEVMVHMRMGGATNRSLRNILRQNLEIWDALKRHDLRPSLVRLAGTKVISRGWQYLSRPARTGG